MAGEMVPSLAPPCLPRARVAVAADVRREGEGHVGRAAVCHNKNTFILPPGQALGSG